MELAQNIVTVCWIIFLAYWVASAQKVKATQEKTGGIGGITHWILIIVAFFIMQDRTISLLRTPIIPQNTFIAVLSVMLAIGGLILAIMARKTLANNWSGSVTFKKGHELITKGVYNHMRHPIYTAVLLMFLGSMVLYGSVGAVIGFVIIAITFWLKLKQEEKLLTKHFPKEYPAYKKRVKALIPALL